MGVNPIQSGQNATQQEDPNAAELMNKVTDLVQSQFSGNWQQAFDHYAGPNGEIDRSRLATLLGDANIGNMFTRPMWVSGVMSRFDTDQSDGISWEEFQAGTGGASSGNVPLPPSDDGG
jgi:hypothetical protein